MYASCLERNLARIQINARLSLSAIFLGLGRCYDFIRHILLFLSCSWMIQPIIDGDSTLRILLYGVRKSQARHLPLTEYVVKRGRANTQLFCNAPLFFVIIFYPFRKFIHPIPFLCFFLWTKYPKFRYHGKHSKKPKSSQTKGD